MLNSKSDRISKLEKELKKTKEKFNYICELIDPKIKRDHDIASAKEQIECLMWGMCSKFEEAKEIAEKYNLCFESKTDEMSFKHVSFKSRKD